jgi:hypothetical protein
MRIPGGIHGYFHKMLFQKEELFLRWNLKQRVDNEFKIIADSHLSPPK